MTKAKVLAILISIMTMFIPIIDMSKVMATDSYIGYINMGTIIYEDVSMSEHSVTTPINTSTPYTEENQNKTVTVTIFTTITYTKMLIQTIPITHVVTIEIGLGVNQAIVIITIITIVAISVGYYVGYRTAKEKQAKEVVKKTR